MNCAESSVLNMIMSMTTIKKSITCATESSYTAGEGVTASILPQSAYVPTFVSYHIQRLRLALMCADRRNLFPVFVYRSGSVFYLIFNDTNISLRCFEFEDSYKRKFVSLEYCDDNFIQHFRSKVFGDSLIPMLALLNCSQDLSKIYIVVEVSLNIFGVRSNNQGYLVGVELNPGPDGRLPAILLVLRETASLPAHLQTERVIDHLQFLVQNFNDYENILDPIPPIPPVRYLLEWGFLSERGLNFLRENIQLDYENYMVLRGTEYGVHLRNGFGGRPLQLEDYHTAGLLIAAFANDVRQEFEFVQYLRENNMGFLIGVELNPGPKTDLLLMYLRAQSRAAEVVTPPRASSHKRGGGHDKQARKIQWVSKTLVKAQRKRNSIEKRLEYEPEALLETGLDADTKAFLQSLLNNFRDIMSAGVNVNIDFTTSIVENVRRLLTSAQKHFVFFYDLLKFVFGVLYAVVDEKVKMVFALFSELFIFSSESTLDTMVLMAMYKSTIGKHLGDCDVLGMMRLLRNFKKDSESISSLRSFFMTILQTLIENLNHWLGTGIPVPTGNPHLDGFWNRFRCIKDELGKENVIQSELAVAMYALNRDVEDYFRECTDPYYRDQARFLLSQMRPKVEYCEATINPNNGPRIEPLSICVAGPTGVGKSTFAMPSLLALSACVLPKESRENFLKNHNDLIFFRAPENEYWDGLKPSHQIIVFDEFGQIRDVAGSTNTEAFELIRLVNMAPYHLHYAGITDKQKNYANPKVVMAVTNRNEFSFNSIISNEAVIRRFHIAVCQMPKLEFCVDGTNSTDPWSRRLDMEKVRAKYPEIEGDVSSLYVVDALEFIEWDFAKGHPKVGGRTMNYDEFIQLCVSKYRAIHQKGDSLLKFHQYMKEKYIPEGGLSLDSLESEDLQFMDALESQPIFLEKVYAFFRDRFMHYRSPRDLLGEKGFEALKKIGAFLAGIFVIKKLWSFIFPPVSDESAPLVGKKKAKIQTKQTRSQRRGYARDLKMSLRKFQPESAVGEDGVVSVIRRNVYRLYCDELYVGTVLFVKGSVFCYPKHFDYQLAQYREDQGIAESEPLKVRITPYFGGEGGYTFDWYETAPFTFDPVALNISSSFEAEIDICFAQLPKGYRDHRNIVKWFASENVLKDGYKFESVMAVLRGSNEPSKVDAVTCLLGPTVSVGQNVCYLDDVYSYKLQYYAETEKGDCGSPLFSRDKRLGGPKILGVHTAGATNFFGRKHSAGVMLTREMVEIAIEHFEDDSPLEDEEIVFEEPHWGDQYSPESIGGMKQFPFVRRDIAPRRAMKSQIVHSPFYGKLWPLITGTSRLVPFFKDGIKIDPSWKAKMKYCTPNVSVDQVLLNRSYKIVSALVLAKTQIAPWKPRLFSFAEAINGVDGVEFVESINRTSSAGYPHVLAGLKGKKKWLGTDGKVDVDSPQCGELRDMVEVVISKAKQGIRCEHIYMDCLKDERRPLEKVADGSTRQFMACPVQFLVAVRMYFGDFLRHINQNRVHNGISIGVDPGTEWQRLYVHLHPAANYVHGAGDYKSFDCYLSSQVCLMFLEMCESFYAPTSTVEDVRVRRILFQDIINSVHIDANGVVYEFSGKNPSGQPTTADLNSVTNALMIVCAWLTAGIPDSVIASQFRWITGGDDHVTGFPIEWADKAGSISVAKELKKLFGYTYTDEAKGSDLVAYKAIEDVTFLKRSFKKIKGKMCAPLDLSVILETLNWMRNTSDRDNFEQRINMVLVELAQHGAEVFRECAPRIISLAHEHDFSVLYGTFDSAFAQTATFSFE